MAEVKSRISQRRSAALTEGGADYSAKRAELIRVAATVFREKGYAAATLNDIAAVFGTDRASLYYYVGSKEELFQAAVTGLVQANLERAEAIAASDLSPRAKLRGLVETIMQSQVDHYPYMHVYIQEDMRQVPTQDALWATQMVEFTHRMEACFITAIEEGVKSGAFRSDVPSTLLANSLFGMMMWTHRWFVPGRKYTADDIVDAFDKVFFEGVEVD